MALKKQVELKSKITLNAYCRIDRILYNRDYSEIIVNLYNESEGEKYLVGSESQTFTFKPDILDKKNIVEQAYIHLKSVDFFIGAKDC